MELFAMRLFAAYAGPSTWGEWVEIASHLGDVSYTITASPVGNTVLRCRVRYYKEVNNQVTEEWRSDVKIKTANVVANVEVSFMGVPFGSAVEGTITP
jgi:hypothetical protein